MSATALAATRWAWKQDLPSTPKFVLVALADFADKRDHTCWPKTETIAERCKFSVPSVQRAIKNLLDCHFITQVGIHRSGVPIFKLAVGKLCRWIQRTVKRRAKQIHLFGDTESKTGDTQSPKSATQSRHNHLIDVSEPPLNSPPTPSERGKEQTVRPRIQKQMHVDENADTEVFYTCICDKCQAPHEWEVSPYVARRIRGHPCPEFWERVVEENKKPRRERTATVEASP